MVQFYYKLVKKGKITIDKVPTKYREHVRLLLLPGSEVNDVVKA